MKDTSIPMAARPQHRRMKTRTVSIKHDAHKDASKDHSKRKIIILNKTNQASKSRHRRSGTALVGGSLKISNSSTSFSGSKRQVKVKKDVMKRLKRNSIGSSDKFKIFSIDKSRSSGLGGDKTYDNLVLTTFKKPKDFPLPISGTSKRLKKAIKARLSQQY